MKLLRFTEDALNAAVECLLGGGVVLLATDTVYGVAAHPDHPEALERIRQMKSRDARKPFQLLASDIAAIQADGACWSPAAQALADRLWPGALTLVLNTTKGHTEGYRIPDHPLLRQLIARCGGTLRCTSVNLSGEPPAKDAIEAAHNLPQADLLLDDGPAKLGRASTVIALDPEGRETVLRA